MDQYDYYRALEKLSVRTGMYIGEQTLRNLQSYMGGYEDAMREAGIRDASSPDFVHFRDWLKKKFGFESTVPGWVNMVLALTIGSAPTKDMPLDRLKNLTEDEHNRSIKLFFSLLKEYRSDTDFAKATAQQPG